MQKKYFLVGQNENLPVISFVLTLFDISARLWICIGD